MSQKLTVLVSQYIVERHVFAIAVQHDLCFLDYIPHPVILHLADGTKNNGSLISQFLVDLKRAKYQLGDF